MERYWVLTPTKAVVPHVHLPSPPYYREWTEQERTDVDEPACGAVPSVVASHRLP